MTHLSTPEYCRRAAEVLRTLGEPRRLDILLWLLEGPQLTTTFHLAYSDLSKSGRTSMAFQLVFLKSAGLVQSRRRGSRGATYSLTDEGRRIAGLLAPFVATAGWQAMPHRTLEQTD